MSSFCGVGHPRKTTLFWRQFTPKVIKPRQHIHQLKRCPRQHQQYCRPQDGKLSIPANTRAFFAEKQVIDETIGLTLSLILPKRVAPGVVGLYFDSATLRANKQGGAMAPTGRQKAVLQSEYVRYYVAKYSWVGTWQVECTRNIDIEGIELLASSVARP